MQIQKEEVRKQILTTSKRLFVENKYSGTSLKDIAKYSGISKSNIYNYFKTKEEIFDTLTYRCKVNVNVIMSFLKDNSFEDSESLKRALLGIIYKYIIPEREGIIILYEKEMESLERPMVSALLKVINSMVVPDLTVEENKKVIEIIVENLVRGYIDILKSVDDKETIQYRMMALTEYHVGGLANLERIRDCTTKT